MKTTYGFAAFAVIFGCNQGVWADTDSGTDADAGEGTENGSVNASNTYGGETEGEDSFGTDSLPSTSGASDPTADTAPDSGEPNEAACGPGTFETPWEDCGTLGALQGTLRTSISDVAAPPGSSGLVTLRHRQDIDEVDDGCITDLALELYFYSCILQLHLQTDGEGRARLRTASFIVDSMCPGFVDGTEGEYSFEGEGDWWPLALPPQVQDRNAQYSCLASSNWCFPDVEIPMFKEYGEADLLTVNLADVTLTGSFASEGFVVEGEGAPACRVEDSCEYHGGGAWCAEEAYACIADFAVELGGADCAPCSRSGMMSDPNYDAFVYGYCLDDTAAVAEIAQVLALPLAGDVLPEQDLFALTVFEVAVPAGATLRIYTRGVDFDNGYDGYIWVGERGSAPTYRNRLASMFGTEETFYAPAETAATVDIAVFVNRIPSVVLQDLTLDISLQ